MSPEQIKALRLRMGLTQQHFSTVVGCTVNQANKWENGRSKPSPMSINRLKEIEKANP